MSLRATAKAIGVNPGTLSKWIKRGCPLDPEGAARWRDEHVVLRAKRSGPQDAAESFAFWRARREKAAAIMAEREVQRQAGELVAVDDVITTWTRLLADCRQRLLAIPSRLAAEAPLDHDQRGAVYVLAEQLIYEALEELSESDGVPHQ